MYYIVYGLLYLLSLLPLRVLYILSDGIYALIYYVFGYRRKVVMANLQIAFPEKTEAERTRIAKNFYHNFVDNFIETIKILSAGKKWITKHFVLDSRPFDTFYKEGKKCQFHLGHNFNWELANVAMPYYTEFPFLAVYMPIKSKVMDRLFINLRSKTGCIMLPATDMRTAMVPWRNKPYMLALVADQAPGDVSKAYWLNFFGAPTPFVRGPESGARMGNIPVIFAQLYKVRRGYYHAHFEVGADNPAELPEGELTRRYILFLENAIREHPDMWLWSHRRWKWEWKEEYKGLWVDNLSPGKTT
jgi:Kdo2-lipid IVA lauroyltransferase/acyltransferase